MRCWCWVRSIDHQTDIRLNRCDGFGEESLRLIVCRRDQALFCEWGECQVLRVSWWGFKEVVWWRWGWGESKKVFWILNWSSTLPLSPIISHSVTQSLSQCQWRHILLQPLDLSWLSNVTLLYLLYCTWISINPCWLTCTSIHPIQASIYPYPVKFPSYAYCTYILFISHSSLFLFRFLLVPLDESFKSKSWICLIKIDHLLTLLNQWGGGGKAQVEPFHSSCHKKKRKICPLTWTLL